MSRFRPTVEALEAREVPAVFYWTGAQNTDANNPYNWSVGGAPGLPGAGDVLHFSSTPSVPIPGQPSPPPTSAPDCVGLLSLGEGTSFAAVYIESTYTGTVTIAEALTFGTFLLAGGAISQGAAAHALTVEGTFDWTDGVLNSSTTAATFTLNGALGTITPGAATLLTSSSFFLLAATLSINPGTLQFNNGTGFDLGAGAAMFVNANAPAGQNPNVTITGDGKPWTENDTQLTLRTGATLTVTGPGRFTDNHYLFNEGGTVEITGNVTAVFGPLFAPPPVAPLYAIIQRSGTIKLHSGSTLEGSLLGVHMQQGLLLIIADSPSGEINPARIRTNFRFDNGFIGFQGNYWTFQVNGNVYWSGGTFVPRVDVTGANGAGASDIWQITGTLSIPVTNTAKVAPLSINYRPLPAQLRITIFDINEVANPTIFPGLIQQTPGPVYQWFVDQPGGTQRLWQLGPG